MLFFNFSLIKTFLCLVFVLFIRYFFFIHLIDYNAGVQTIHSENTFPTMQNKNKMKDKQNLLKYQRNWIFYDRFEKMICFFLCIRFKFIKYELKFVRPLNQGIKVRLYLNALILGYCCLGYCIQKEWQIHFWFLF